MNVVHICRILILFLIFASCAEEDKFEKEIKALRKVSNQALKNRDIQTLSDQWTHEFTLISSRGKIYRGKAENIASYQQMFDGSPDEWYERNPQKITLHEGWNIATEQGQWIGEFYLNESTYRVNGTYLAKWVKQGEHWKLQSEYYAPSSCNGGPYCNESPSSEQTFRFHHTALYVSNMDESVSFYLQIPGLKINQEIDSLIDIKADGTRSPREVNITFLKFDGSDHILELIENTSAAEGSGSSTYQHVGITVDNIESVWKKMLQAGAQPMRAPWSLSANGSEVSIAFMTGPDGETLEIMQWK
ncbi:MAG: VOC family protein [Fulvivirga sp.]|nr:VOC family protein [Fulvivirga sp.]